MKAEWLRIGNVLKTPDGIRKITAVDIWAQEECDRLGVIHLSAVPLTKDWFEFFDFVETDPSIKIHDVPCWNDRSHRMFLEYHLNGWYVTKPHIIDEIEYVHQFQNLAYWIVGELKVKPLG